MTAGQKMLYNLAMKMCFKPCVPAGVLEDLLNPESANSLDDVIAFGRPLPEVLEEHRSMAFPAPCFSPMSVSSALVFLSPAIVGDLGIIVGECHKRNIRVGAGTLILSEHLEGLVMKVLNPTGHRQVIREGVYVQAKRAAFEKSRVPLEFEDALSSRLIAAACAARAPEPRKQKSVHAYAPETSWRAVDTNSLSTRPTRSTGDLPKQLSTSRPSDCDRPHRQKLHGRIRSGKFQASSKQSSCLESKVTWQGHRAWEGHDEYTSPSSAASASLSAASYCRSDEGHGWNAKGYSDTQQDQGWDASSWKQGNSQAKTYWRDHTKPSRDRW
eukprot:TRINITY_DN81859_c0_g1_i1.p1 TRINITY_DN81859_c0_g1~~TRINITY_DN81859_c0_g1_i1.p1  ORF type:complete len:345 (-),score=40.80 TRINITY_DN81859_c0_g1_i1:338-1318(-)